ncbi:hypothetical protein [Streptomyces sp. cg36]|uniref:hypothetical protein n=1 Tax=Streptomyces sp. cg36 TaxID=3238798 RepID=UPI0034E1E6B3
MPDARPPSSCHFLLAGGRAAFRQTASGDPADFVLRPSGSLPGPIPASGCGTWPPTA